MKAAIISQARIGSARLPGKVLFNIKDKSLLQYHIERLKQSCLPVIIATTTSECDDSIVNVCQDTKTIFFRGDEDNVLCRYYKCAVENKVDIIIRVTSDCPLVDGSLIKKGIELFEKHGVDYLSNTGDRTFPRGFDFEILNFNALETAYANADTQQEREHVTPYIWRTHPSKFKILGFMNNVDKSQYRITVDTNEDFTLVKKLIEDFDADKKTYKEIIKLLDDNQSLARINKDVKQKIYWK